MEKRIYSLNLMAFISLRTDLMPKIESDEKGVAYGVFPECDGVMLAINEFRERFVAVELHSFTNSFKQIKQMFSEHKNRGGRYAIK